MSYLTHWLSDMGECVQVAVVGGRARLYGFCIMHGPSLYELAMFYLIFDEPCGKLVWLVEAYTYHSYKRLLIKAI